MTKADISSIQSNARPGRSAKRRYRNSDLPFENHTRDLQRWQNAVQPVIIDWAGTVKEPFAVNSHPDLQRIVEEAWHAEFPEIPCNEVVHAIVSYYLPESYDTKT